MLKSVNRIYLILVVTAILFSCRTKKANQAVQQMNVVDTLELVSEPIDTLMQTQVEKENIIKTTSIPVRSIDEVYEAAYLKLEDMLEDRSSLDFKRAVFISENAYFDEKKDYAVFNEKIQTLVLLCNKWIQANPNVNYVRSDSINFVKNMAIYSVMKDTVFRANDSIGKYHIKMILHYPFTYDFDDYFGKKDWTKMFVSKLINTNKGNCHSLPYLYKILSNELGATAYISMAPSHFYIKNRSKEYGWYNTELTSGDFPTDAWITASGYISLDAIRSGIFMDTLSLKQSVGLCAFDLAKGYERRLKEHDGEFVIKCCNLTLKHHPNNVSAMILKAETLKKQIEGAMRQRNVSSPSELFSDAKLKMKYEAMQTLYVKVLEMGYREMPERMYVEWLASVDIQKNKYSNQKINNTFKQKSKR